MTETTQRGLVTPSKGQSVGNSKDMLALWRQSIISVDAALGSLGAVANLSPEALAAIEAFDAGAELGDATVAGFIGTETATRAALDGLYAKKTHVTVGPGGDYDTIADVFTDYPNGGVDIECMEGALPQSPVSVDSVHNVTIRGQGRDVTTLVFTDDAFTLTGAPNSWAFRDFTLKHADGTNSHNAIDIDEPRRCVIERLTIRDFGGTSIHLGGGLHTAITHNYILARDSTFTNGYAGIHINLAEDEDVATTITTERNYIGGGGQYGILVERGNIGCVHIQDIAEHCDVGMRFEFSKSVLISPYTEANTTAGIQLHDCLMPVIGELREEPAYTWAGSFAAAQRRPLRIGRDFINPGRAIILPVDSTGVKSDPTTTPAITAGSGNPEGAVTAVRGSVRFRSDGFGPAIFVKETGTGNTGWVPVTPAWPRPTTDLSNAAHPVNTENKYEGRMCFDTTTNRPVWATGSSATDPWVFADGSTAVTPS